MSRYVERRRAEGVRNDPRVGSRPGAAVRLWPVGVLAVAVWSGCLASCARNETPSTAEPPADLPSLVDYLVDEQRMQRPVEARLSAGFAYGTCRSAATDSPPAEPVCGEPPPAAVLDRVALALEELPAGGPDAAPSDLQARALILLATSRRADRAEEAVRLLRRATAASPESGRLSSDLAAAYFLRARRWGRPLDYVYSLARAEEAVRHDPDLPEARFNKALALQELGLRTAAMQAWHAYLDREREPEWAAEAALHLRSLEGFDAAEAWPQAESRLLEAALEGNRADLDRIVATFRLPSRLLVENRLLPEWAAERREGSNAVADAQLRAANAIGSRLADLDGDRLLKEAMGTIAACLEMPEPRQCEESLLEGHAAYGEGMEHYDGFRFAAAREALQRAANALARVGSPLEHRARLYLALCDYQDFDYSKALAALEQLRRLGRERGYFRLEGRASWVLGLVHLASARPLEAVIAFRAALERLRLIGDQEGALAVHSRMADALRNLGEEIEAWEHLYRALRGLHLLHTPRQRHSVVGIATLGAIAAGEPLAARYFQDEAVRLSRGSGDETELAFALVHRAAVHSAVGEHRRALDDLREAEPLADATQGESMRLAILGKMRQMEGRLLTRSQPERAVEALRQAEALYRETNYLVEIPRVLSDRAAAHLAAGSSDAAEAALVSAAAGVEREWAAVVQHRPQRSGARLWPDYFGYRQQIFERLAALLVDQGRWREAFDVAERARTFELLDLLLAAPTLLEQPSFQPGSGRPMGPRRLRDLQTELPSDVFVVELLLTGDRIMIWIVSRRDARLLVAKVEREQLEGRLEDLHLDVARGFDPGPTLEALHATLAAPVVEHVPPEKTIVFIPDESLHWLPFAALRDPQSKRYLIERNPVSVSPSATLYAHAELRDRELAAGNRSVLVVANPAFDRAAFAELPPLPGARAAALQVTSLYEQSKLLTGEAATKGAVLSHIGRYETVHVAGHALLNTDAPFLSLLPLAPDGESEGVLYAHELFSTDLGRARRIVLSACSTAGGPRTGIHGVSGFVRPLLGGSVPTVVASLWDVYDRATFRLFTVFHQELRQGRSAAAALRAAQLTMLRDPNSDASSVSKWAAFEVFGASAPNQHPEARRQP